MTNVKLPTCAGCPHNLCFGERFSKYHCGVTMHPGEHFCTCGKRARKFKRGDPKVRVPEWCPKRKKPCELRIYEFKDAGSWYLHELLCHDLKKEIEPSEYAFAVAYEGVTELSPKDFWERCGDDRELLGVEIHHRNIVEIDDGLSPVCFFKTINGYRVLTMFNTEAARKNPRRDKSEEA